MRGFFFLITCHLLGTNDKSTKSELLKWKTFEIQRDSARSRQKFYPIKKVLHDMTLLGPKEGSILPSVNLNCCNLATASNRSLKIFDVFQNLSGFWLVLN